MLTDVERAAAAPPSVELLDAAIAEERRKSGITTAAPPVEIERETGDTLLSAEQRQQCIRFLDAAKASLSPDSADVKITIHDELRFGALLGLEDPAPLFAQLKSLHGGDSKIALRRTEGPVEGCIGFHFDGNYATETVQLTLNCDSE